MLGIGPHSSLFFVLFRLYHVPTVSPFYFYFAKLFLRKRRQSSIDMLTIPMRCTFETTVTKDIIFVSRLT